MPGLKARSWASTLFESFDEHRLETADPDPIGFPGYSAERLSARESTGAPEAVLVGTGTISGTQVSAVIFDFAFMGGSMSTAVGMAVESAMQSALEQRMPFVCVTASGGARMQEGMAALAQMPRTIAASHSLSAAGIPRISILGHPTTGGVYASFASLSDFVGAEEGATIGFAGPRVAEALGGALPPGSHTSEQALAKGLLDYVGSPTALKAWLADIVRIVASRSEGRAEPAPRPDPGLSVQENPQEAWEEFQICRHPKRPSPRDYLSALLDPIVEMRGDRAGQDDPAIFAGIGKLGEHSVAFAAIDRKRPNAAGFRKATRVLQVASRLGLPVVTMVDTPGADPGFDSEYAGLARSIAETFETVLTIEVPVITVVTGEGGSGGALALACGDRVAMLEHAVFSVIAPEGAAAILYKDPSKAPDIAGHLRPTSRDIVSLGLADVVLIEPRGGAHADVASVTETLRVWLSDELSSTGALQAARAERYRLNRQL